MSGPLTALALAAAATAAAAAPAAAQSLPADGPKGWLGAGGGIALSQPGTPRGPGPAALAAVELPILTQLWLRLEASGALQPLERSPGGILEGDVQQARLVAAARLATPTVGHVAPYLLAGGGVFWRSDRLVVRDGSNPVPGAEYRLTSSGRARGALLGVGASAPLLGARPFVELRWTRVGAADGPSTDLGLVGGVTLPLAR